MLARRLLALPVVLALNLGAPQAAKAEESITVINQSAHPAKVAAPGGKTLRVPSDGAAVEMPLSGERPQGVDAKAWWTDDPRQLCIIFVRYGGLLKITGKGTIRCLGN